jgi:hypothetical protein
MKFLKTLSTTLGFSIRFVSHHIVQKKTIASKRFWGSDWEYNEPISRARTIRACFCLRRFDQRAVKSFGQRAFLLKILCGDKRRRVSSRGSQLRNLLVNPDGYYLSRLECWLLPRRSGCVAWFHSILFIFCVCMKGLVWISERRTGLRSSLIGLTMHIYTRWTIFLVAPSYALKWDATRGLSIHRYWLSSDLQRGMETH